MSQPRARRRQTLMKKPLPSRKWNPFRPFDWDLRDSEAAESRQIDVEMRQPGNGPRLAAPIEQVPTNAQPSILSYKQSTKLYRLFGKLPLSCFRIHRVEPVLPYTTSNQIRRTLLRAPINALLICVPVGFVLHFIDNNSIAAFIVNFMAALPLFSLAEVGMSEISLRVGEVLGGLLYLSTCNLTQLISCVLLLRHGETTVLRTTLTGSILANLLFILGLSSTVGGLVGNRVYQYFNPIVSHVSSNILSLAATSLLIPTASKLLSQATPKNLARQSRGASVVLIAVYILFLVYQLKTHKQVFKERSERAPGSVKHVRHRLGWIFNSSVDDRGAKRPPDNTELTETSAGYNADDQDELDDSDERPKLHGGVALAVFILSTAFLFFSVEFIVDSIDALTTHANVSRTFVGLVLFPLPNCDFAPINYAIEDKMDIVMSYTIGKCLQTALLVTPCVVLLAWWVGVDDVTLVFDGFQVVSLFAAVLMLNFLIIMGRGGWIQGVLLLADWGLIAIAAFYVS